MSLFGRFRNATPSGEEPIRAPGTSAPTPAPAFAGSGSNQDFKKFPRSYSHAWPQQIRSLVRSWPPADADEHAAANAAAMQGPLGPKTGMKSPASVTRSASASPIRSAARTPRSRMTSPDPLTRLGARSPVRSRPASRGSMISTPFQSIGKSGGSPAPAPWKPVALRSSVGDDAATTITSTAETKPSTMVTSTVITSEAPSGDAEESHVHAPVRDPYRAFAQHAIKEAVPAPYFKPLTGHHREVLPKYKYRFLFVAHLALGIWYLYWRWTSTMNLFSSTLFMYNLWTRVKTDVQPLDKMMPPFTRSHLPAIDITICCYSEPPELVANTVRHSMAVDYPPEKLRVVVCDDGGVEALRECLKRTYLSEMEAKDPLVYYVANEEESSEKKTIYVAREKKLLDNGDGFSVFGGDDDDTKSNSGLSGISSPKSIIAFEYLKDKPICTVTKTIRRHVGMRPDAALGSFRLDIESNGYLPKLVYIGRDKPPVHHAKAGNLNNMLFNERTYGDGGFFVLFLDADMVPKPQTLNKILPYFYFFNPHTDRYELHPKLAFVQTPQVFTNVAEGDPFGHNNGLFFGPIMMGRNGANATPFVGTNALCRWDALDAIGGFPTGSVTEDVYMSMRLHANQWQTLYHHEALIFGLAPDDVGGFFAQRARWAVGSLQMMLRECPLFKRGLNFTQRIYYFDSTVYPLSSIASMIFFVCPIIYAVFNIAPMLTLISIEFLYHFLPFFIAGRIAMYIGTAGVNPNEEWRSQQLQFVLTPVWFLAVIQIVSGNKIKFTVTRKDGTRETNSPVAILLDVIYFITVAAMIVAVVRWFFAETRFPWILLAQLLFCLPNLYHLQTIVSLSLGTKPLAAIQLHNICVIFGMTLVVMWQFVGNKNKNKVGGLDVN
eukprot:CAMPEP_0184647452 /NCGR_PEP_ID=MMETSP0308-20130426/4383_1 /TAXON_ID=38269 /ORGANISM="Gloeochaete witrockiana, Strain SAG 46.84" /LENGTH=887 /DNA_ID=CAMNT_0027078423 /DNA_START=247 /DNA_END=2910 /DNA_ORIENTATION=-